MSNDEEIEALIDDLVSLHALIPNNKDGEKTYLINTERMQEVFPSFYDLFMEEIDETLIKLVEDGLVTVNYDENLKPWFSLTEEGRHAVDNMIISDRPQDF